MEVLIRRFVEIELHTFPESPINRLPEILVDHPLELTGSSSFEVLQVLAA